MTNRQPETTVLAVDWKPCVVIPVYNHEHAITIIIERLATYELPIILVNDGSSEACSLVLRQLADKYPAIELVELIENQGKGGAVKAGLNQAFAKGYSHALQIDADGQHDTDDVPKFLQAAQQHSNAVITGYPKYDASVPAHRYYGRYLTHVWIYINTLSFAIKDSMCGFRVYPLAEICDLLSRCRTGNRMDFDSEVLVRWVWSGGAVVNLETEVKYPLDGVSHFALWRDNVLISRMHAKLFFGMLWRSPMLLARKLKRDD